MKSYDVSQIEMWLLLYWYHPNTLFPDRGLDLGVLKQNELQERLSVEETKWRKLEEKEMVKEEVLWTNAMVQDMFDCLDQAREE